MLSTRYLSNGGGELSMFWARSSGSAMFETVTVLAFSGPRLPAC